MNKPKYVTKNKRIRQLEKENQQLKQRIAELEFNLNASTLLILESTDICAATLSGACSARAVNQALDELDQIESDWFDLIEP